MINQTQKAESTNNVLFQELDNKPKTRIAKKVLDRDDFMLLFIKQLEYQDPLKPLENNEMATQLALFNQLDELYSINQKFDSMISIMKNNNFNLYTSIIGKTVEVEDNIARVENGKFMGARLVLEKPTQHVIVKIADEKGNIVRTIDMGSLSSGEHIIEWDAKDDQGNKLQDGVYKIMIQSEDEDYSGKLYVKGKITSVSFDGEETDLVFNNKTKISLDDIKKLYDYQENNTNDLNNKEDL